MVDDVPARFWSLIVLAAAATAPVTYIYRHIAHDPARRDITLPPLDVSWRSSRKLALYVLLLAALCALAIFIFTPSAQRLTRAPSFPSLVLGGLGIAALVSVVRALKTGFVRPLIRGFSSTYERSSRPRAFWASMVWNAILAGFFLSLAAVTFTSIAHDSCINYDERLSKQEQIAACDQALADADTSAEQRNDLFRARGIARHELRDTERAIDDYNRAIELDPEDSYALYNRGLLYLEGDQTQFAIEDFTRSLALRPDNKEGYQNRSEAYLRRGAFADAIADLTRVLAVDPNDERALAARSRAYSFANDIDHARQDLARLRRINPASPRVAYTEAALSLATKDFALARDQLTRILRNSPDDIWALNMLALAYAELDQRAEAQAIRDRIITLERKADR